MRRVLAGAEQAFEEGELADHVVVALIHRAAIRMALLQVDVMAGIARLDQALDRLFGERAVLEGADGGVHGGSCGQRGLSLSE